jgi:hypothetical protein
MYYPGGYSFEIDHIYYLLIRNFVVLIYVGRGIGSIGRIDRIGL